MDGGKRQALQMHLRDMVQDLDVAYIMDDLFTRNALSRQLYDTILSNISNRAECVRLLLDGLIQTGDNAAYEAFVDSLSKHYRWLWEKLTLGEGGGAAGDRDALSESTEDALGRGDVPRLPPHYVRRLHQEGEVATRLRALPRHEALVLHGMPGCGKTTAAAAALRHHPDLLHDPVYWLHLADCRTEDDILTHQRRLYRKAWTSPAQRDTSLFSSSVSSLSSTADSHSLSLSPPPRASQHDDSLHDLRDSLRTLFMEPSLKDSIVVLDDVGNRAAAEAFDIGCRLLATTRDLGTFAARRPHLVAIASGFTEDESLEVFASCLRVEVARLPRAARRLHALCKGGPLQVSLLGAHLAESRERLLHDPSHWNYYVDKLTRKDFFTLIHMRPEADPTRPVKMCIASLPPDVLPLFKRLAVLRDGVQVSARALARLWGESEARVESIMRQLHTKSLVLQHYVKEEKNYLYEVHELILSCVRAMHSAEEMRRLHAELLARYGFLDVPAAAPPALPDDGYIAYYLAHHIYETGNTNNEWSLFNKLFLDLEFVGAKVRLAGQADVVMDLTNYQDQICLNELDYTLVEGLREWLGAHGADLHRFPHTDILQSVLQHASSGALYSRAYELASRAVAHHRRLYFTFLHEQNVEDCKYKEIDVGEAVTCICFLRDYILVGLHSGSIKVVDTRTYGTCAELEGGAHAVLWVGACPVDLSRVASLDAAGVLRVRCFRPPHQPGEEAEEAEEALEEEEECVEWEARVGTGGEHGALLQCRWAHGAELLLAHTATAVLVYGSDAVLRSVFPLGAGRGERVLCCTLTPDDASLLVASEEAGRHRLHLYHLKSGEKLVTFPHSRPLMQILCMPNDRERALAVSGEEVWEHTWRWQQRGDTRSVVRAAEVAPGARLVRAALSTAGALLYLATDDARVLCLDLHTRAHILDLPNRRGNVLCMDVSELWLDDLVLQYDVLGTADQNHCVRVWHLDTAYTALASSHRRKARLTDKFACSFPCAPSSPASGRSSPPAAAASAPGARRVNSDAVRRDSASALTPLRKTGSLSDKNSLKLNLKGITSACAGDERTPRPLLAVLDDKNNVQVMRGRRVFSEVSAGGEAVTALQMSPCSRYVVLGLKSGAVRKFLLRSKEMHTLCNVNSAVVYLEFVTPHLLVVAGRNRCVMAYHRLHAPADPGPEAWRPLMLLDGNAHLGSQELLDDIFRSGSKKSSRDAGSDTSDGSVSSRRIFGGERGACGGGGGAGWRAGALVRCFWLEGAGLLTLEEDGCAKLWDRRRLRLARVLSGRRADAALVCADMRARTLAFGMNDGKFQTLRVHVRPAEGAAGEEGEGEVSLETVQEYKLNSRVTAVALSHDGRLLAAGLHNGHVVVWNINAKYQLALLKLHKSSVTSVVFSPEAGGCGGGWGAAASPGPGASAPASATAHADAAPLVLASVAAELVWWDVTHAVRARRRRSLSKHAKNVLTPVQSPCESALPAGLHALHIDSNANHFFGDAPAQTSPAQHFQQEWKGKGSGGGTRREVLACVKLAGVSARRLFADDTFSCFVTVDSSGAPHLMHLLRPM